MNTSKIIYSINLEDIQNVAEEELGRRLTKKELQVIEDKIGDYITGIALLIWLCKMKFYIDSRKRHEDLLTKNR